MLWVELTLCPPLQWMVPTIQNSMKPFKVSGQGSPVAGGGVAWEPAEPCPRRIWTIPASSSAS